MSFISLGLLALCFLTTVTQVEAEKKNDENKVANQLKERNDDSKSGNSDHEMPSSRCYAIPGVSVVKCPVPKKLMLWTYQRIDRPMD